MEKATASNVLQHGGSAGKMAQAKINFNKKIDYIFDFSFCMVILPRLILKYGIAVYKTMIQDFKISVV